MYVSLEKLVSVLHSAFSLVTAKNFKVRLGQPNSKRFTALRGLRLLGSQSHFYTDFPRTRRRSVIHVPATNVTKDRMKFLYKNISENNFLLEDASIREHIPMAMDFTV